ncbi:histone H2B 1.2-like [Scyliorhinus canicula]|uniref:histone H2B 1.2-like n=1 Tax=Scyliorhinus canicula TaxID=7830 RepID=UPI0018F45C63|nr:histone H2B 1.2-like [Scyliorhinus canicula]
MGDEKDLAVSKKGGKKALKKPPAKGSKNWRRSRKESYHIYVHKVMKQVRPDTGNFSKAISCINSFINDTFERIRGEASRLVHDNKQSIISSWEIQTAMHLRLPGELAKTPCRKGQRR